MNGIERTPKGAERIPGRSENLFFIPANIFDEPIPPGGAVRLIGFFVDGEICRALGIVNSVEAVQSVHLRRRNFRNLRFVGIQRRNRFGNRAIGTNITKGVNHVLCPRK